MPLSCTDGGCATHIKRAVHAHEVEETGCSRCQETIQCLATEELRLDQRRRCYACGDLERAARHARIRR